MNKRRLFASAMAACMLLSTMPSTALAADTSPDATIVSNAAEASEGTGGTVTALTPAQIENNASSSVTVNVNDITVVKSEADETVGRAEGWYVGFKMTAPEGFNADNAKYESIVPRLDPSAEANDWGNARTFAEHKDGKNYIEMWASLGSDFAKANKMIEDYKTANKTLDYKYHFDWNGDGEYEQEVVLKIYPSKITLATQPHTHSWSSDWSKDERGHWHTCTADDCTITDYSTCEETGAAYSAHDYTDASDTTCNICGYKVVNVVAMIGNTSYASLQDAVDAALNAGATTTGPVYIDVMAGAAIPEATVNKVGTFIVNGAAKITAGSSVNMTTTQVDKGVQYTFTAKPTTPSYDYDYDYTPPVSSGSNTTTQKNPDGSTTTTKTDKDGTVTETTKHTDGSTSTVETAKDGTVTTTEKDAKGNKTETVEKTDGTKEFTAKQKDGSEATASVDRNGAVKAEVELTQKALNNAATNNEAVTLPIPAISVDKFSAASTITVDLPDNTGKTSVVVPMEEMTPGSVVVMVLPDGTEKVVIATKTVEEGLAVELDGDCTFKVVDNSKDFADVKPGDWFSDATDFVSSRELFAGTSETEFSPNAEMTMEMLFAVAHNFMGKPERTGTNDIAGAKPEDWFHTASNWAAEAGLTDGLKMDMLGRNQPISREDTAILLYNLAGVDYTPSEEALSKLNSFSDIADMDPDNLTALAWVVENGIMNGMGDGTFGFKGNNTRAQTGAIMMNFNNNL